MRLPVYGGAVAVICAAIGLGAALVGGRFTHEASAGTTIPTVIRPGRTHVVLKRVTRTLPPRTVHRDGRVIHLPGKTVSRLVPVTVAGPTRTVAGPTRTITGPGGETTVVQTLTIPGPTTTLPGSTVTGPGSTTVITVTQPGTTVTDTLPGTTVTLPGSTVTETVTVTAAPPPTT